MSVSARSVRIVLAVMGVAVIGFLHVFSTTSGIFRNGALFLNITRLAGLPDTSGLTSPPTRDDFNGDAVVANTPIAVLLVTYMRSGSSFTGELFHVNPYAVYIFEPLYYLHHRNTKLLRYMNGTSVKATSTAIKKTVEVELIRSFFTCRMDGIFLQAFRSHFDRTKDSRGLVCKGRLNTNCVAKFAGFCEKSGLRAIKTIRLSLEDTFSLLENLPSLKIVHLLRDPRAIMTSRSKIRKTSVLQGNILCQQMAADLSSYEVYAARFPSRLMQILYEDIAEDTLGAAKYIYSFLNMDVPAEVTKWIKTQASGDNVKESIFSTRRRNSSETASKWRVSIPWNVSSYIDKHCSHVYNKLGFIAFNSEEELRNLDLPSRNHVK